MRTDRPYRNAMSYEAAAEQMSCNAGTQFDPAVVEAMLRVVAATEGPVSSGDPAEAETVTASVSELASAARQLAVPAAS